MIEYVKTARGLMRADSAALIEANRRARDAALERGMRQKLRAMAKAEARQRGLGPIETAELLTTISRMTPDEALRITGKNARDALGPDELARRYPCRGCRVLYDDGYKAACAETNTVPCFAAASFKGCLKWQPRLVSAPTGGVTQGA